MTLPKQLIAESFSRAATSYDAAAFLQQEVANRLMERLEMMRITPAQVLDVGCGTGYCSRALRKKYAKAKVHGIDIAPGMVDQANKQQPWLNKIQYQVADADELPFADNQFDLVFSNLTIQWLPDLAKSFKELNRILKPGGLLIFSTLGPDTLMELRQSWRQVDDGVHVNEFIDMHLVGDAVNQSHFENTVMDCDRLTLTYKTVVGLMRDLKAIGAHNVDSQRQKGLLGKSKLAALQSAYESFRAGDGTLPATYEVVYGHAWKKTTAPKGEYHSYQVKLEE